MPQLSQGDIFETIKDSQVELAIVFGHIGFNQMHQGWKAFSASYPQLVTVHDPFSDLENRPVEISVGKWLWCVPEEENHGMTDTQLSSALDCAFSWASHNQIKKVATNGITNSELCQGTAQGLQSDNQRALFIVSIVSAAEIKYGISVELISLNNVFARL